MACGMAFNGLLVALLVTLLTASVPATLAAPSAAESMPTQEDRLLAASSATRANTGPHYRLPVTAIPLDYKVALTVDNTDTFTGDVSINTVAVRAASFFKLHVNPTYIKIKSASVVTENKFPEVTWTVDEELQIVTFTWPSSTSTILVPGTKYRIDITFDGTLRTDMYGFYRSTFKTVTNNVETEIRLAATQFEPTHARSAFPCWDEPNYKATFDLSITHTATQYSMANTPGTRATLTGDRVTTTFQKTPRMSTYLVAFVVTDVQFEQPSTTTPAASATQSPTSALPYGVYVRPDHRDEAKYAADVGPKSLSWLSDFTGIPYSTMGLNKLDLIAIPDFSAGAMENWGLITFRETGLMFLEGESTESSRESIALVIAHEQAHMWFGDLVSPEWWGYLWLNEGFARYMQYVAMDKVQPQWKLMETYVVKSLQGALAYDALASTHPMSATVHAPNEISGIFDMISYDKGAAILHMTRNTIGEENFKTAIRSYLTEMMYFSAAPQDLFRAFDTVAAQSVFPLPTGVTMATVLKTWTEEAGYPVVTIQTTADGSLSVNQSLFSSTESAKTADTRWWVPLTYVVDGGAFSNPSKMWLDPSKDIVSINEGNKAWVIANIDQTGFYRVNYDEANWQALGALLQSDGGVDKVPQLNRAQLLDDALSLAQAGLLRYNIALDFTRYLHLEKHPSPWTAVLTHLAFLYNMLAENSAQEPLKTYILEKLDPVYKVVGFAETETDTDANHQVLVFRATLLGRACKLGHPGCVSDATAAFRSFVDSGNTPKPSQRSTVYCTGLRNAATATAASDWNFLWKRYSATTTSPGERTLILGALGCTSDAEKLRTYLGYSLDSTMVRSQDAQAVFSAVLAGNRENVEVAFQFFKDNLQKMSTQYGGWSSMQRVVQGLASNIYDEDKLKELEEVLTANSAILGSTEAGASRSLETARSNLQWRARHLADVSAWVTGTYSAAAPSAASPLLLAVTLVAMLTRLSA